MVDLNPSSARRCRCEPTSSTYKHHECRCARGGLPQVFADAHQEQQVLLNLIINASRRCDGERRGTSGVRSWHDVERESIVLEINDDGPGIAESCNRRF